jgi:hypothetical protein
MRDSLTLANRTSSSGTALADYQIPTPHISLSELSQMTAKFESSGATIPVCIL